MISGQNVKNNSTSKVVATSVCKVREWMHNGTNDLDASYGSHQRSADSRGYMYGRNYISRVLRPSHHNQWSWARRLPDAIEWWLRGI